MRAFQLFIKKKNWEDTRKCSQNTEETQEKLACW